jgi:hypothetical protein
MKTKRIYRVLAVMIAFVIMFTANSASFVAAEETSSDEEQLIYDYFEAVDSGDWEIWANYYALDVRDSYIEFVENTENHANNIGILTVNSAAVISITQVTDEAAPSGVYDELEEHFEDTSAYNCYKVVVDMSINEDNGYYLEGINEKIIILINENGEWKVGSTYNAPQSNPRLRGVGQLVGFCAGAYSTKPSIVRVKESSTYIVSPTLSVYVRNTIQNEVGNLNYPSNALKALCVASQSHVWWFCLTKYWDAQGYDIRSYDGTVNYHSGTTINSAITTAYNSVSGYYIKASNGLHFSTPYNSKATANSQSSGQLYEDGAKTKANQGMTWQNILHYYFDNSTFNLQPGDSTGIVSVVNS